MKAEIIKRAKLTDIPSASGVEIINGIIYVIGDDSNSLFSLNHNLQILQKLELFESKYESNERIPKKKKPDFECMTYFKINGYHYVLINGSGSKENRDNGYLVKLPTKYNKKFFSQPVDFKSLYNLLRSNEDIVSDGKLNIEASAYSDDLFVLMNRANKKGNNAIMVFNTEEFQVFLAENSEMIPFPEVFLYELPKLESVNCGFSGACIHENKLFFTASAEDTEDAVEDGSVKGSILGWIEINPQGKMKGSITKTLSQIKSTTTIRENDHHFYGKVESIAIFEKESESKYIAIAVTDSDDGVSELIMLEINL
ncbi:MAG: hypothetical protein EAZ07_06920 [Cytophagales bacterium]|nr:MAG: hypothetical protein EAZ07_06920 [Cytophagales bacterium]